jgi:serine-type D-Ala-D-Ala carboxypeptidase/endopeptidase (penicillin-binding protein 4)
MRLSFVVSGALKITAFLCIWLASTFNFSSLEAQNRKPKTDTSVFVRANLDGKLLSQKPARQNYIPASIIKIATASYALFTFGENYRFSTYFYETPSNDLVVKGAGDPGFTSDDLRKVAYEISRKRKKFKRIIFDDTFYGSELPVPGRGNTSNPYDAPIGAISVNYNTVVISKAKNGLITTGEAETPLTDFAKKIGYSLAPGMHRVRIGGNSSNGITHFYQLFKIFLKDAGVEVSGPYLIRKTPQDAKLLLQYESSKTLKEHVRDLLKYSNNFIANQLFYVTSVYYAGPPATFVNAKEQFRKFLDRELGFEGDFYIEEGAGLSRKNRITITQGIRMLTYFYPYRDLLSENSGMMYKSGTLSGVSNLAGYHDSDTPEVFLFFDSAPSAIPDRVKKVKNLLLSKR